MGLIDTCCDPEYEIVGVACQSMMLNHAYKGQFRPLFESIFIFAALRGEWLCLPSLMLYRTHQFIEQPYCRAILLLQYAAGTR